MNLLEELMSMPNEPSKPEPTKRLYVRCTDCLGVSVALDHHARVNHGDVRCGICGGHIEAMGYVVESRLVTEHTVCKCNERCVDALGPNCSCKCGGANHGHGMTGYMQVEVDGGSVTITPPEHHTKLKARADEYRAAAASALERLEAHKDNGPYKWKRSGEYVSGAGFNAYLRHRDRYRTLADARKGRTHKGRLNKLNRICT